MGISPRGFIHTIRLLPKDIRVTKDWSMNSARYQTFCLDKARYTPFRMVELASLAIVT